MTNKKVSDNCYLEYVDGHLECQVQHTKCYCLLDRCQYCDEFKCKCYEEEIN